MSELIRQTWGSTPSATGQKRSLIGYCAAYFIRAERQLAGPQS